MPVTLRDLQGLSPQEIASRFTREEIQEALASRHAPVTPVTQEQDGGFGNRGGFFDIAPVNENESFFSLDNLGRAIGNVPGSAANMVGDLATAVANPVDTAKGMYDMGVSGFIDAMDERFGSLDALKRTAVEDPFGLAVDVAPIGRPIATAARAGKMGATAARVASNPAVRAIADPTGTAVRGAVGATKKAGQATASITGTGAGVLAGLDDSLIKGARQILSGTDQAAIDAFKQARRGKADAAAVPKRIEQTLESLRAQRGAAFKAAEQDILSRNIHATRGQIQEFHNTIANVMQDEFDIPIVKKRTYIPEPEDAYRGGRVGNRGVGERGEGTWGAEELNIDYENVGGLREAPAGTRKDLTRAIQRVFRSGGNLRELWKARMDIDRLAEKAMKETNSKVEAPIFGKLRDTVTNFLEDDRMGGAQFRKLNKDYREATELIRQFEDVVGAGLKESGQIAKVRKAVSSKEMFDDEVLANAQAATGVPLAAGAIGTEYAENAARGLVGRNKMATALFAGTAIFTDPKLLAAFLFASPKRIGATMEALGATERKIREAASVLQTVQRFPGVNEALAQGVNLGTIFQQLNDEEQRPGILGTLGGSLNATQR